MECTDPERNMKMKENSTLKYPFISYLIRIQYLFINFVYWFMKLNKTVTHDLVVFITKIGPVCIGSHEQSQPLICTACKGQTPILIIPIMCVQTNWSGNCDKKYISPGYTNTRLLC